MDIDILARLLLDPDLQQADPLVPELPRLERQVAEHLLVVDDERGLDHLVEPLVEVVAALEQLLDDRERVLLALRGHHVLVGAGGQVLQALQVVVRAVGEGHVLQVGLGVDQVLVGGDQVVAHLSGGYHLFRVP